jgi:hypothetical protein
LYQRATEVVAAADRTASAKTQKKRADELLAVPVEGLYSFHDPEHLLALGRAGLGLTEPSTVQRPTSCCVDAR